MVRAEDIMQRIIEEAYSIKSWVKARLLLMEPIEEGLQSGVGSAGIDNFLAQMVTLLARKVREVYGTPEVVYWNSLLIFAEGVGEGLRASRVPLERTIGSGRG